MKKPQSTHQMPLYFLVALLSLSFLLACQANKEATAGYADQMAPPPPLRKMEALPAPPPLSEKMEYDGDGAEDGFDIEEEPDDEWNTEEYSRIYENPFQSPQAHPLSTFSIDVDVASYANVRRFLTDNEMPPAGAVRIEELINYFNYDYPAPTGEHPFSISTETGPAPWHDEHYLVHIGLKGMEIDREQLPPSNLVFLLDVSGSMNSPNKLPLLKSAFNLLVENLRPDDKVAIAVYAGAAGLVLPSTPASDKGKILDALDQLSAGGSTAGGAGIQLAYEVAKENFKDGGNNRVILATDGDFNIGLSSEDELVRMIEKKREDGIFLSVLGFGSGNYKDSRMEQLADKGNGNYAYIDNIMEAKKVLVKEMGGTLFTIAKDVKLQIEFNPAAVKGYRLIGYENRLMAAEDFDDDTKDAGEMGAGHTVTAIYEVVPVGASTEIKTPSDLKYQQTVPSNPSSNKELLTVKFRYKKPDGDTSTLLERTASKYTGNLSATSDNYRFSAAVAGWGMLLRDSEHSGDATYASIAEMARGARGEDPNGYRSEFVRLAEISELLDKESSDVEAKK